MILSKKTYFMTAKLIFVEENKQLLTTHLSWIKLRLSKQIKQDTIWQELCQKHEKRECTCVRTHEGWHPPPYMQLYPFWMIRPILPTVAYVLHWWPLSQPKNIERHSYSLKHKYLKKKISLRKNKWQCRIKKTFRWEALIKTPLIKCQLCMVRELLL